MLQHEEKGKIKSLYIKLFLLPCLRALASLKRKIDFSNMFEEGLANTLYIHFYISNI